MVFSFRFWWLCNSKHTEGVPMAQLFATEIYTTIWTLPSIKVTCLIYISKACDDTVLYRHKGFIL